MGRLKVFAYCTHSLQTIKTRHNYFVWNISKTVDRLSAACRLTVGQQTADSRPTTDNWPTVDPQLTDSLPTKGQQSPDSWQTDERHLLGTVLHFYKSYNSNNKLRLLARKFYGIFIVIISWRTWKRSVLTSDWLIDWFSDWCVRRLRQIMKIVWKNEERQNVSCLDDSYPCPLMLRLKHPSLSQPRESAPHWKHKRQQENLTTKQVSSS